MTPDRLPAPVFRLAVTGALEIDAAQRDRVRAQLAAVLRAVREEVCRAVDQGAVWSGSPGVIRALSPLAEGADRLFAEVACEEAAASAPGCRTELEIVLPFARADYEATFGGTGYPDAAHSLADFRRLLDHAHGRVAELDGAAAPDETRQRSYEALGQTLVRAADLVIAVWDAERTPRGRGGTADTVRHALRSSVPVLWIDVARDVSPAWLEHPSDIDCGGARSDVADRLAALVRDALLPPPPHLHDHAGPLAPVIRALKRRVRTLADPLHLYLRESGRTNPGVGRIHDALLGRVRRHGRAMITASLLAEAPDPCGFEGRVAAALRAEAATHRSAEGAPPARPGLLRRIARASARPGSARQLELSSSFAAALSRKYQQRYRSSYLMVMLAGAVALTAAALALKYKALVGPLLLIELVALLVIAGLWMANEVFRWHERYLAYRVLAELLRGLPWLNQTLRGSLGADLHTSGAEPHNWCAWLFAATVRAAPFPAGAFGPDRVGALHADIRSRLIDPQIRFHRNRWLECLGAERFLGQVGAALFFATFVVVVTKGVLHLFDVGGGSQAVLGVLAAVLPALSAAVFGLRSYEEFGSLADQSEAMVEELTHVADRFDRIETAAPLALQDIGAETAAFTRAMLTDLRGWSQLFRTKAIEG